MAMTFALREREAGRLAGVDRDAFLTRLRDMMGEGRAEAERILIDRIDGHGGTIQASASSFEELACVSKTFRTLAADQGIGL